MDFPKSEPGVGLVGGEFVDENPTTGQAGSLIPSAWGNAVTNEILNVIKSADLQPDEGKTDQLLAAVGVLVARYAPPSVLPVFMQGFHAGSRASLAVVFGGMATPDDGLQLAALTHPEIVRRVLRGDVKTCSEAEWQADPNKRGMWSLGTAALDGDGKPQGWVRMSDRNGVQAGSLPPPFWRGGADAKVGSIGKDTMRNLKGRFGTIYGTTAGVFYEDETSGKGLAFSGSSNFYGFLGFDASRALPAGHVTDAVKGEFAPWHIYGVSYTITANGTVNEAALDAAGVMAQIFPLQSRLTALEAQGLGISTQVWVTTTSARLPNVPYVADQSFILRVTASATASTDSTRVVIAIDGEDFPCTPSYGSGPTVVGEIPIKKGSTFSFRVLGPYSGLNIKEFRRAA